MIVAIGADHAGYELKQLLAARLRADSYGVIDCGAHDSAPSDYPDYAAAVGQCVLDGRAERGVLVCGSGVGASVAVNKLPGLRGGLCHDTYSAHQGVEHDDMNVLVLGARVIGVELAGELVRSFLRAHFTAENRHRRRLDKIAALEGRQSQAGRCVRTDTCSPPLRRNSDS